MEFGIRIVRERPWYFVGVDLGQKQDYSAIAVVERAEVDTGRVDPVTYQRKWETRYRVTSVRRVARTMASKAARLRRMLSRLARNVV